MTRVHDPVIETAEQVEEMAARWVTRIDLHGTPDEWTNLDAWLAASPRHRAAFLRLSVAWRRADQLKNLAALGSEADENLLDPARWAGLPEEADSTATAAEPMPPPPSVEPIERRPSEPHLAHLQGLRVLGAEPREHHSPRRVSANTSRLAASFVAALVLAAAGYGGWMALNRGGEAQTFATVVGEYRRIALPDGSTLGLNTDSRATVRFSPSRREVTLERGEALFRVAHNAKRPFDVRAGATVVRAVGTEFAVRLRDESSVDVTVAEGKISINPPSRPTLAAGTVAFVRGNHIDTRSLPPGDISDRLAWSTTMKLPFTNATIGTVVAELNRYNARKLEISSPELAEQRIGGAFQATDPDGFASALESNFHVHARRLTLSSGAEVIRLENGTP
jgi:transmembrane sensor